MDTKKTNLAPAILLAGAIGLCFHSTTLRALALGDGPSEAVPAPRPGLRSAEPERAELPPGVVARLGTFRLRHAAVVTSLAFSPDGEWLVSGSEDWRAIVWDAKTGRPRRAFAPGGGVAAIALSPDAKTLATADSSRTELAVLWDVASGRKRHELKGHKGGILAAAFSPDGKTLVTVGADRSIRRWDVATGGTLGDPLVHSAGVNVAAFSHDFKRIALGGQRNVRRRMTGTLAIHDLETGKAVQQIGELPGTVFSLAFSPDDETLAVGDSAGVTLYEAATGKPVRNISLEKRNATALTFTDGGRSLVAGCQDGTVHVVETATGKELLQYDAHTDLVRAVAVSPDGTLIATGGNDNRVHVVEAATGRALLPREGHLNQVTDVVYSIGGKRIATAGRDNAIILWDAESHRELRRLVGHGKSVRAIALSADGRTLVSAGEDSTVRVWDAVTGRELRKIDAHRGGAPGVALSPDGKHVLSGGGDGTVRLSETATGREVRSWMFAAPAARAPGGGLPGAGAVRSMHKSVDSVAYAPDGTTFAAMSRDGIAVWDAATGSELWRHRDAKLNQLTNIAYAPDGRTLATAGTTGAVHVWETQTGLLRCRFQVETVPLLHVEFSPDGRQLAFAGGQGIVHLRDAAVGTELPALDGHHRPFGLRYRVGLGWVRAVTFSPDGRRLAAGYGNTTVLIWNVPGIELPDSIELTPKEAEVLWNDLADKKDGARVHRAIARLLSAAPEQALPVVEKSLEPLTSPSEQPKRIARLIAQLDSESFHERETATAELAKIMGAAAPALRETLEGSPSAEMQGRIKRLLQNAGSPELTGERLRALRALEVLERLDHPEARRRIAALAKGAGGSWLTNQARGMQHRLERRGRSLD